MTAKPNMPTLRQLAEAATPGPWERRDTYIGQDKYHASTEIVGRVQHGGSTPVCLLRSGFVWFEGDCAFIAAANPQAILSLLDRLDALEACLREIASAHAWSSEESGTRVCFASDSMHDGDYDKARAAIMDSLNRLTKHADLVAELKAFDDTIAACFFASRDWWAIGMRRLSELGLATMPVGATHDPSA